MACPYCGSGDWEEVDTIDMREDGCNYVAVYRNCNCLDCGREFVSKTWFKNDDTYECMTVQDWVSE